MKRLALLAGSMMVVALAMPARAGDDCSGCAGCTCGRAAEGTTLATWRDLGEEGLRKQLRLVRWQLHELNHSDLATADEIAAKRAEFAHYNRQMDEFRVAQSELRLRLAAAFAPRAEIQVALAPAADG